MGTLGTVTLRAEMLAYKMSVEWLATATLASVQCRLQPVSYTTCAEKHSFLLSNPTFQIINVYLFVTNTNYCLALIMNLTL